MEDWGWRWYYGSFAIITPFACAAFWTVFWLMARRAAKIGLLKKEKSDRTIIQSILHWCVEFDGKPVSGLDVRSHC
jgi:hypothetical protein